jgi:hypothetical protein
MSGCNRPWLRTLGLTLLALLAMATLLNGLLHAWLAPGGDMYLRLNEYGYFRSGVFPHPQLALRKGLEITAVSVYPPYAMPMFAPFFHPGGAIQGRLVIQALSLLSLGLIGWVGQRLLRGAGTAAGVLGALAGAAISGNSNALAQGQFSLICMGLITCQWLLLARQRRIPAGLCWALAMLKPQIALPFALPFLRARRLRGLVVGVGLLVALGAVAFWHTGVTPLDYLQVWTRPQSMDFIRGGSQSAAGDLADSFGLNAAASQLLVAGLTTAAVSLWWWCRRRQPDDPLQTAAVCAAASAVGFYHLNYDNILLFPALLMALRLAITRQRPLWRLLAVAMALSLWTPQRIIERVPLGGQAQLLLWLVVGVVLALQAPELDGVGEPLEPRPPDGAPVAPLGAAANPGVRP